MMLNHFPATYTSDMKALHYLTAANQPQRDASLNHGYSNEIHKQRPQIPFSSHDYRCCRHNTGMGWPYYIQNMWQATQDNGLLAFMYGPNTVTAKVGKQGNTVTLTADTSYPFRERVTLDVSSKLAVAFPLYLRIPEWSKTVQLTINGREQTTFDNTNNYLRIRRTWSDGDQVGIHFKMDVSVVKWPRDGSVSIKRGPLWYSVLIEEEWRREGGTDEWPRWLVYPKAPWNYGLVLNPEDPGADINVTKKDVHEEEPWSLEHAPIELTVRAKKIPGWKLHDNELPELQVSPIKSDEPVETIRMAPSGSARLRMSSLPEIGDTDEASYWVTRAH